MAHSTIRTQYGVVPFEPWPWQRELIDGLTPREIVLKSRDVGSSEILIRFFAHRMLLEGGNLVIKADKAENGSNLVTMARHYLMSLPSGERPTIIRDNLTELELDGIGRIIALPQRGGRSERCRYLLMTERAFFETPEEELAAVSGALVADGWLAIESTANGFNEFHGLWADTTNGYRRTFVDRWANPTHTPDWWALKQRELASAPLKLRQEYPETPLEAFIASGMPVFDPDAVQRLAERVRPPVERLAFPLGYLSIWQQPTVGRRYIVGTDCAYGYDTPDAGVSQVLDWQTGAHVASLWGHFPPEELAERTVELCKRYNQAFLGVEANGVGQFVLRRIDQLGYATPQTFYYRDWQRAQERHEAPREMGWYTTGSGTRPVMVAELGEAIKTGALDTPDEDTVAELRSFVHLRNLPQAAPGAHDDRVMAMAIALQMRVLPFVGRRGAPRPPQPSMVMR